MDMIGKILHLCFASILAVTAIQDLQSKKIRRVYPIAIILLSAASCVLTRSVAPSQRIGGFFCTSLPLLICSLLAPGSIGGGDIWLTAACGLYLGAKSNLYACGTAVFLAGLLSVALLIAKKADRGSKLPLAPFLCLGAIAALFRGPG